MLRRWWQRKDTQAAVPETKAERLKKELGRLNNRFEALLEDVTYESEAALRSADLKEDPRDGSMADICLKERMTLSFNTHSSIGYRHIIEMNGIVHDVARAMEKVRQEVIPREYEALEKKHNVEDMKQRLETAKQVHDQAVIDFVQKQPDVVSQKLRVRVQELAAA